MTTATTRTRDEINAEARAITAQDRKIDALQNEGGEGYDHTNTARLAELHAELAEAIVAEWDKDTTITRRQAWNDAVRSGKYNNAYRVEQATGIKYQELRNAIARHELS